MKAPWPDWSELSEAKKAEYLLDTHKCQTPDSLKALFLLSVSDYDKMAEIPSYPIWVNLRRDGLIDDEYNPVLTDKGHDYVSMYGLPRA